MLRYAIDIDTMPTAMTLEREGFPGKCCLGCCAFHATCRDGMYLHAGGYGPEVPPGSLRASNPRCVSFASQPACGGGFTPTINVMERAKPSDPLGPQPGKPPEISPQRIFSTLAKVEGPCCFGGCYELCASSKFTVSALSPEGLDLQLKVGDLATIVKRKPSEMEGMLRELVTDADVYTLQFNPAARLAPQQKASLLATLVLADFMFFEADNPPCSGRGCHMCTFYCAGCLCPVSCINRSGGAGPGSTGSGGFAADQ